MVEETTPGLMDLSEAALPGRQRAPVRSPGFRMSCSEGACELVRTLGRAAGHVLGSSWRGDSPCIVEVVLLGVRGGTG